MLDRDDTSLPARHSTEERAYFEWLATMPCMVTGERGVQLAHVRGADSWWGKLLPGTGQKPLVPYIVPLAPYQHRLQEADNWGFWEENGFPRDPAPASVLFYCWALWRLYSSIGRGHVLDAAGARLILHRLGL